MSKYTKKWQKEFEKRYSAAVTEITTLDKELLEMRKDNPDEFNLSFISPKNSTLDLGEMGTYGLYDFGNEEIPYVDFTFNFDVASVTFKISDLKTLIGFRDELIKSIDTFKRPLEKERDIISSDCDEDLDEDTEETEWTIKAEQPLTQSWTYTVMARSACEAIKKIEEDEDGVENNDDNEYYDYGEIEYEAI
jgi:hypothetical protein